MNRADERDNAEIAASAGVSPHVVDYVEDMDVMVLEFIEGHVPTMETPDPRQVRRIADAVRPLHGGPRSTTTRTCSTGPSGGCAPATSVNPGSRRHRVEWTDSTTSPACSRPRIRPTVPCHNDLAPYNFIDDGEQLWIIDFEFSGNNDPCFDLGMIASEAELDEDLRTILCEAYFGEATPWLLAR